MDAFISHSSDDIESVRPIELALEKRGLDVWLDDSDLRQGVALAGKLQQSIRDSRSVVLVWSKSARRSRWVNAEWLMAIHIGRTIIAVAIDPTKVPQCLENTTYLRVKAVTPDAIDRLERDIREAPDKPDALSPMQAAQGPELYAAIGKIAVEQQRILDLLGEWKVDQAAKRQTALDPSVWRARRRWRCDPRLQTVAAYHLKNAYMIRHWDAVQAVQGPKDDPVLARAERWFFRTLSIDPWDPEALNGLGSILMFRRNTAAAEFFIVAAIEEAKRRGMTYPDAEQDLKLVRRDRRD